MSKLKDFLWVLKTTWRFFRELLEQMRNLADEDATSVDWFFTSGTLSEVTTLSNKLHETNDAVLEALSNPPEAPEVEHG